MSIKSSKEANLGREYVHAHQLPDGRWQTVYYDGPEARFIVRLQIAPREWEDDLDRNNTGPTEYRCEACRNWGTGTGTEIEWERPLG
jgi:hypothetical protein